MIVPIPTGVRYTATLVGYTYKHVHCEHCQADFVYLLQRQGVGAGSAPLYDNVRGAKDQAFSSAEGQLGAALREGGSIIPCPNCGKYQSDMIRHVKHKRIISAAAACAVFLVLYGFIWNLYTPPLSSPMFVRWGLPGLLGMLLPLTALMTWICIHDLNARAHARKGSKPGIVMLRSEYETLLAAAQKQMNPDPTSTT